MPSVDRGGTGIYYSECGRRDADPLVLIMGLGADSSLWADHVREYEQHFRCILIDNRGAGQSDKPEGPYTTSMMADDTLAVMDAIGIESAHVAGISMGGAIAQELAIRYPARVRRMVLVSTWAKCNVYAASVFDHFRKMREVASADDFMELIQLWIFAPAYFEANQETLKQVQREALDNPAAMPNHAFAAQCDACIHHDATDRLDRIQAPTLITIGEHDIFTPPSFSYFLHDSIARSELLPLPNTGHAHHWELLEPFNRKTAHFLLAQ